MKNTTETDKLFIKLLREFVDKGKEVLGNWPDADGCRLERTYDAAILPVSFDDLVMFDLPNFINAVEKELPTSILTIKHLQQPTERCECSDAFGDTLVVITKDDFDAMHTAGLDETKEEDIFTYAKHLLGLTGNKFYGFNWISE